MELGVYTLIKKIAEGGVAEIYLAKAASKLGRDKYLICKCIKPSLTSDNEFIESIIREAHLSVSMRHPNILEVFDLCCSDGRSYLTMEYMDAPDFQHLLMTCREKGKKLPLGIAVYIISQAALGLHYAHELKNDKGEPQNLVHRDISPENILLNWAGDIKISDFGIAKTASMPDITPPETVKGKFGYMSPEQAWADKIDRRSDIFSLGIVLYEALLDTSFYGQSSIADKLMAARIAQFAKPTELEPDFPADLEAVLLKALDLDKKQRYQTALDFKLALDEVAQAHGWIFDKASWATYLHTLVETAPAPLSLMTAGDVPPDVHSLLKNEKRDIASDGDEDEDDGSTVVLSTAQIYSALSEVANEVKTAENDAVRSSMIKAISANSSDKNAKVNPNASHDETRVVAMTKPLEHATSENDTVNGFTQPIKNTNLLVLEQELAESQQKEVTVIAPVNEVTSIVPNPTHEKTVVASVQSETVIKRVPGARVDSAPDLEALSKMSHEDAPVIAQFQGLRPKDADWDDDTSETVPYVPAEKLAEQLKKAKFKYYRRYWISGAVAIVILIIVIIVLATQLNAS